MCIVISAVLVLPTSPLQASNSPIFFTVIAVPADPRLELDIRFSVFAVQGNAADDEDQVRKLQREASMYACICISLGLYQSG